MASHLRLRDFPVARIPDKHILYAIDQERKTGSLYITDDDNGKAMYRIYRQFKRMDEMECYSLVHETLMGGKYWKNMLYWLIKDDIYGLLKCEKINESEYGPIYIDDKWADLMAFDSEDINYNRSNNKTNLECLMVYFVMDLKIYLSNKYVEANLLYYRIFEYNPLIGKEVDDPIKLFLSLCPDNVDKFDLLSQYKAYNVIESSNDEVCVQGYKPVH